MAFCTACRGIMPTLAAVCPHCGRDYSTPTPMPPAPVAASQRVVKSVTAVCVILFVIACARPAYWAKGGLNGGGGEMNGVGLLVIGPLFCMPPWLANVTLAVGLISLWVGRLRRALLASVVGLLFALTPLVRFSVPTDNFQLRDGYVWWLATMAALLAGSVVVLVVDRRAE